MVRRIGVPVLVHPARRWGWKAALLATGAALAAGCGASTPTAQAPRSTTSTVLLANSPSQVTDWVTTTLDNAVSLVHSGLAGTTEAELLPVAQQLATACGISQHELTQTTWTGRAQGDQMALGSTLSQIESIVNAHSPGFGQALNGAIQAMSGELAALAKDVSG